MAIPPKRPTVLLSGQASQWRPRRQRPVRLAAAWDRPVTTTNWRGGRGCYGEIPRRIALAALSELPPNVVSWAPPASLVRGKAGRVFLFPSVFQSRFVTSRGTVVPTRRVHRGWWNSLAEHKLGACVSQIAWVEWR